MLLLCYLLSMATFVIQRNSSYENDHMAHRAESIYSDPVQKFMNPCFRIYRLRIWAGSKNQTKRMPTIWLTVWLENQEEFRYRECFTQRNKKCSDPRSHTLWVWQFARPFEVGWEFDWAGGNEGVSLGTEPRRLGRVGSRNGRWSKGLAPPPYHWNPGETPRVQTPRMKRFWRCTNLKSSNQTPLDKAPGD